MILYPTNLLKQLNIPITLVVGHQKNQIKETVTKHHDNHNQNNKIDFVTQEEQRGTGHAIVCTQDSWKNDHILIMNGDMPLVTEDIIETLYKKHLDTKAVVSFVIAHNADPTGKSYGRIIKNNGSIQIVEAKHFEGDPHEHCFINAGIYIVSKKFLEQSIDAIEKNEKTKEFYFTDLIKIASDNKNTITTTYASFDRIRGINDMQELWAAEQIKRSDIIRWWMSKGVRFTVPQNVHLDLNVSIGSGTVIGGGVHILCNSTIGKNCEIHEFSSLKNATLKDNVTVQPHCVIKNAKIGNM